MYPPESEPVQEGWGWAVFLVVLWGLTANWLLGFIMPDMEWPEEPWKFEGVVASVDNVKIGDSDEEEPVAEDVVDHEAQQVEDRRLRVMWAEALVELRERRQDDDPPIQAEQVVSTQDVAAQDVPATPVVETVWQPQDECERVPEAPWLTERVMAHCPLVARHLDTWTWDPGDLTFYMTVLACESGGDETANQRNWGTGDYAVWGLFSHRRIYWPGRSMLALGRPGVIGDNHDDVHTALWLVESGHQDWDNAWDGCAPRIREQMDSLGINWEGR